jgi:hypothetical protein
MKFKSHINKSKNYIFRSIAIIHWTSDAQLRFRGGQKNVAHTFAGQIWLSFFQFYIVFTSKIKPNLRKLGL